MAGTGDFSLLHGLQNGTPFLTGMGTGGKLALAQIGLKFPESIDKALLFRQPVALDFKSGETRRVCHIAPVLQLVQFHLPGGMASTAQLLTDLSRL